MKKIKICLLLALILLTAVSCNKKEKITNEETTVTERAFTENRAYRIFDDGWVYSFGFQYDKGDSLDDSYPVNCNFYGINLRYRYSEDYTARGVPLSNLVLGKSEKTPEINRDMKKIAELLKYDGGVVTKGELLSIKEGDLGFEALDEKVFIELMREALTEEAGSHRDGDIKDLPQMALLTEQQYLDDYKFQIGILCAVGCVDVIYIDVLYKTGNEYNSYMQLSDMVAAGEATDEQKELYELLNDISVGIVSENNLSYGIDDNEVKCVAGVDIGRLYHFLKDIGTYNWDKYLIDD